MNIVPKTYLWVFRDRNFLILSVITFLFQATTAFVLLALIVSAFSKTDSNFAVSGVVVSFVSPALLFTAIAGFFADLFDRKKILLWSNIALAILVLFLIIFGNNVYLLFALSFSYFAVNSFFLPTVSAISAQLVPKSKLLISNSVFIFNLAVGQIVGFFVASIVHFFVGSFWNLVICEIISIVLIWLCSLLPPLYPRVSGKAAVFGVMKDVFRAFYYIFSRRSIRFFFVFFALVQGIIAFGVTLGPGFFDNVVGISIRRSPIFALPLVAGGAYLGMTFVNSPKRESFFVALGLGIIGVWGMILGFLLNYSLIYGLSLIFAVAVFLVILGFGIVSAMIASRTVLQKRVEHNFQGSVFGAVIILGALFASISSPLSAELEKLFGYVHLLIFSGIALSLFSAALFYAGEKGQF